VACAEAGAPLIYSLSQYLWSHTLHFQHQRPLHQTMYHRRHRQIHFNLCETRPINLLRARNLFRYSTISVFPRGTNTCDVQSHIYPIMFSCSELMWKNDLKRTREGLKLAVCMLRMRLANELMMRVAYRRRRRAKGDEYAARYKAALPIPFISSESNFRRRDRLQATRIRCQHGD
jgi:hypothetical protein